jgi:hypothetical protein
MATGQKRKENGFLTETPMKINTVAKLLTIDLLDYC